MCIITESSVKTALVVWGLLEIDSRHVLAPDFTKTQIFMLTSPHVLLLFPIHQVFGHTAYEYRDDQMKQLPPEILQDETTNNFFLHL